MGSCTWLHFVCTNERKNVQKRTHFFLGAYVQQRTSPRTSITIGNCARYGNDIEFISNKIWTRKKWQHPKRLCATYVKTGLTVFSFLGNITSTFLLSMKPLFNFEFFVLQKQPFKPYFEENHKIIDNFDSFFLLRKTASFTISNFASSKQRKHGWVA